MFHAVGVTPEAATLAEATGGLEPLRHTVVGAGELRAARDALSTLSSGPLDAVSVGTPHASLSELETLAASLRSAGHVTPGVDAWVSTGRGVLALAERTGAADVIREHGFWFVVDTCTYVTPILAPTARRVMTNSGKWAHYAPANLGVEVAYAPLADCVRAVPVRWCASMRVNRAGGAVWHGVATVAWLRRPWLGRGGAREASSASCLSRHAGARVGADRAGRMRAVPAGEAALAGRLEGVRRNER